VKDIIQLRRLNRVCNQTACSVINPLRLQTRRICEKQRMERFLETFGNRVPHTMLPFTAFSLELSDIPLALIQDFVKAVGQSVVEYTMTGGRRIPGGSAENEMTAKVTTLLSASQKLETLKLLEKFTFREQGLDVDLPQSFPNLRFLGAKDFDLLGQGVDLAVFVARRAPLLDHFQLGLPPVVNTDFPTALFQLPQFLYEVCAKPPKLALLANLSLSSSLKSASVLDSLISRNFNRLVSFRFRWQDESPSPPEPSVAFSNSLYNLLALQTESMEELEIDIQIDQPQFNLKIPMLAKLKRLRVMTLRNYCPLLPVVFNFGSDQFPQLKILDLGIYHSSLPWFNETVVLPTVESLSLLRYSGSAENETFHVNFPNLKTFKVYRVYHSISLLRYVFRRMTGLKELTMGHCKAVSAFFDEDGEELWSIYTGGVSRVYKDEQMEVEVHQPGGHHCPWVLGVSTADNAASLGNFKGKA